MSQIKHFVFPPERRWNLLLLIILLLQHSVSACNISPALLGWNHCLPTAPSSATTNPSAPVPAQLGLSQDSRARLCLLWAAPGGGRGGHNSYRNRQSLSQDQHRTLLCWFWYTTGRLVWFVRNERCTTTWLPGGGKVDVFIYMELNTKIHLHCLLSSASTSESRVGPIPQFQVYFGGKGVRFFRGFHISVFHIGHLVVRFTS